MPLPFHGGKSCREEKTRRVYRTYKYYQQEAAKLRAQITALQNSNRGYMAEGLSNMSIEELKGVETKLEKAISRIRSKKVSLPSEIGRYVLLKEKQKGKGGMVKKKRRGERAKKDGTTGILTMMAVGTSTCSVFHTNRNPLVGVKT